jgi:hypothetical protein
MVKKGTKHDPTANVKHPWYATYRYHKQNPMVPWDSFADFVAWAEKHKYAPEEGDQVTLRVLRKTGFKPRVKKRGCEDPARTEQDDTASQEEYFALSKIWSDMRAKCYDKNHAMYHMIGGRGVKVHAGWTIFEVFMKWARENGYQEGLQLLRYSRDSDFTPSNCCFA